MYSSMKAPYHTVPPGHCDINLSLATIANQQGDEEWLNGGVMLSKPFPMCRRVEMHFHNCDKLDLTANHRQQW